MHSAYFNPTSTHVGIPVEQMSNLLVSCFLLSILHGASSQQQWINHGADLGNRRFASNENFINTATAPRLAQRWKFFTGSDVTATPAIYNGIAYFPSWNGGAYAVSLEGVLIWQVNLTQVTIVKGALSRATPTMTENLAIFSILGAPLVVALDRITGALVWISDLLDSRPLTQITMSGTAFRGGLYVGVSSVQELVESSCCTFQGSFMKLCLCTGKVVWRTPMIPADKSTKFTGVAVWGSSPPIDEKRGLVYVGTGNLYTVPEDVQACTEANGTNCIPSDICDDAIVAMDIHDGRIRWCNRLGGPADIWRLSCVTQNPRPPNCPSQPGPDYDFGEAPMFATVSSKAGLRDIVITGQKSGIVWAHDRTTGELVWQTVAGPGGSLGGAIWGSATDNLRVYTNIANGDRRNFTLAPSNEMTNAGGWVAMEAATGKIIWSTGNPTGGRAFGPVTITNGNVLFVTSFDPAGHVFALDARNGKVIWSSTTNATVYGGFSAGSGCGLVGSGYGAYAVGAANGGTLGNSLFAFCLKPE